MAQQPEMARWTDRAEAVREAMRLAVKMDLAARQWSFPDGAEVSAESVRYAADLVAGGMPDVGARYVGKYVNSYDALTHEQVERLRGDVAKLARREGADVRGAALRARAGYFADASATLKRRIDPVTGQDLGPLDE